MVSKTKLLCLFAFLALKNCAILLNRYASQRGNQQLIEFIQASNKICQYESTVVCCPYEDHTTAAPPPTENTRAELEPVTPPSVLAPSRLLTVEEGCGVSNASHNRVVGGVPAKLNAWPWLALLGYQDALGDISFKCGGSLVSLVQLALVFKNQRNFQISSAILELFSKLA